MSKYFTKKDILKASIESVSGALFIKGQFISQSEVIRTELGTLKFINLLGWVLDDFPGTDIVQAKSLYPLEALLQKHDKKYLFTSKSLYNLAYNRKEDLFFKATMLFNKFVPCR